MSAIADVLWPGLKALEPASELGGILADKPGYHNMRRRLPTSDYSVAEFAIDRQGPDDEAAAIDWTFPNAQSGDYSTIARYSSRLLVAGRGGDPRAYPMREFFGNADSDSQVEGFDFAKRCDSSSDKSHLWHIHISIHRKYVTDAAAMRSILSILGNGGVGVATQTVSGEMPVLRRGMKDPVIDSYYVHRLQQLLSITADGDYGPATAAAVKAYNAQYLHRSVDGYTVDGATWRRLFGLRG